LFYCTFRGKILQASDEAYMFSEFDELLS